MPAASGGWGWLAGPVRQGFIDAGPGRGLSRPDRCGGPGNLRIVKRARPDKDEVRTGVRLAEQMCSAGGAEAAVHDVAAVCRADEIPGLSGDHHACPGKADAHRRISRGDVLAEPAPAQARGDGCA